ncbi:hypothetical protein ASG47_02705 [Devosia sp. Leaf420]|nr:hypothetical protein ASG47_02705 [Devosia sp. Leaf420]
MALTSSDIIGHPEVLLLIQRQSGALISAFHLNPRISSIFATQQRWLLAHAAMALAFRQGGATSPRLTLSRFLDEVERYGIASRNTADAFIKEMMHYHYAMAIENPDDRREKPLIVSPAPLDMLHRWLSTHLTTLDAIDNGLRLESLKTVPMAFAAIEIEVASSFMTAIGMREPEGAVSLFTWFNNGGIVMDWLITCITGQSTDQQTYITSITSISEIADWIHISRTHLTRKLREAETMGSMGWSGKRGGSPMWVSAGFVDEVIGYQAAKLAIIDAACERAFNR